jgi:heme exporter protein B
MRISALYVLVLKEFKIEFRQSSTLMGLLMYVCSSTYLMYLVGPNPSAQGWNTLFWILHLFIATNACSKSFVQESNDRFLYHYTTLKPQELILSKIIFSTALMLVLSGVSYGLFCLFLGQPVTQQLQFLALSFSGAVGLSVLFTFLAAISAQAGNSSTLLAILGFPLIVPQLLLLSKLSQPLIQNTFSPTWGMQFMLLWALNALLVALSLLLFPFVWRK